MGIKVAHNIKGSVLGDAAFGAGKAQGSERRREQDRSYQIQQEVNAIREKARQDANARFYAQLAAQKEGKDEELEFRRQQYEEIPQRHEQLGEIDNDLRKDLTDWQYSRAQQQQLAKIAQARDYVTRNADGRYTQQEQEALLRQIDGMEFGIQPIERKPQTPWPKEQDSGQVWVEESTGATLTRDDKGNVKVLVDPDDSGSFANQLKLKETIASYAKDLYDSSQMSETPLSLEDALKTAQSFFSDLSSQGNPQESAYGDEESMADFMLKEMMTPETYAAAKATGLPSTDIYYMAQQMTMQGDSADSKPEDEDIAKKDWMAKDENFHRYRQGFADSIPQSQVEETYLGDPYIESNNSSLAEPDHKVTTKWRTWDELTNHQRDKAYGKYLETTEPPLMDKIGYAKALDFLGTEGDKEMRQSKRDSWKTNRLTKEQFTAKAEKNNDYLWKHLKVSNKKEEANIDQTQVDTHRMIDRYRKPDFWRMKP